MVSKCGISPQPERVMAIVKAKRPDSVKTLRAFLGTVGFLRNFVPQFARIAAPLTELLKKSNQFNWGEEQQKSFNELKGKLCERVLLVAPKGTVLYQEINNKIQPIEYVSKKLSTEQRWDTREKEAYAIKWALEKFREYIKIGKVILFSDHQSLKWMSNSTSGKVQRWLM
eukprot:GHVL01018225.1.p1 GENE.GHVL01018225.1~~GHVL01018225.1.p1  ORF type:complete len:170 (-),score=22.87 GHVL01018225.1:309-818(-)